MPRDLNTAGVFKAVSYKSQASPPEAAFPEQVARGPHLPGLSYHPRGF